MKAILIDDEPESIQVVSSLLEMYCPHVTIAGKYTNPMEGLAAIKNQSPDVLLLDIEMPEMTGLELIQRIPVVDFEVIFVSAHNQYAVNAFKLSALDYLLKPVNPTELEKAIAKVKEKLKEKKTMEQLEILVSLLQDNKSSFSLQQQKIALPTFKGLIYLQMKDILFIQADQSYCLFSLEDKTTLTVSKNIGTYEDSLDKFDFMRVHRSHIVNLRKVKELVKQDGGYLVLMDGERVDVSKSKMKVLQDRLGKL